MRIPAFTRENPPLALYALLATAFSGFGQTFFISVFGAGIRAEFALTNASYGAYYGLATLVSAVLLLKLGPLADRWALERITGLAVLLLAAGCLVLGMAPHWLVLVPGFLLVRLGGQALLSHLGMTVAGRYFQRNRGRVVALTVTGFPLAEASLPAAAGMILAFSHWRVPWLLAGAFLILVVLPLLRTLARHAAHPRAMAASASPEDQAGHFSRRQVLADSGFYRLLPAALVVPFSVTALLFHQAAVAELRGWTMATVGLAFSGFALGHLASLGFAGPLVDRLGAQRSLPIGLVPIGLGTLVLALTDQAWTPYLYLALTGASLGGVSTAVGALWPERYGTRHIGAIRSLAQSAMVLSTAASPWLAGALLDRWHSVTTLGLTMAGLVGFAAFLALTVRSPARRGAGE